MEGVSAQLHGNWDDDMMEMAGASAQLHGKRDEYTQTEVTMIDA